MTNYFSCRLLVRHEIFLKKGCVNKYIPTPLTLSDLESEPPLNKICGTQHFFRQILRLYPSAFIGSLSHRLLFLLYVTWFEVTSDGNGFSVLSL